MSQSYNEPSVYDFSNANNLPFPNPPLASINVAKQPKLIKIDDENWEEGTDSKQKAYNWIRNEKEKMFDQNKEWVKFRQIFRGMHRQFDRAKRPNRITEYEIPGTVKAKVNKSEGHEQEERGATIVFDPCKMLEDEFANDTKRERDL